MAKKPSLGRQKIKIAKIQIKNHLQVTFSKRRSGLFKKASELCTLCGVEIAIVVFSPAGKVFSFGHPKVESVVDRFLLARNSNLINSTSLHLVEAHRIASIPELNMQLTLMLNELEAEKKRTEALDEMRKTSRSQFWWEAPIEDLSRHELEQLKDSMDELNKIVAIQANKLFTENSNSLSIFGTNNNSIRGGVDHYEMKPTPIIPSSSGASHVQNYGYGHGLFGSFVH